MLLCIIPPNFRPIAGILNRTLERQRCPSGQVSRSDTAPVLRLYLSPVRMRDIKCLYLDPRPVLRLSQCAAATVACHCFYYYFRTSIAPSPSLYKCTNNYWYKEGAGQWKHENNYKNSGKRRHMLFWGRPSSHDVPVSIVQPMHFLHVYNAYFRQSEARNILQICNIICVNGIHILNGGIIFITVYVWERNMLFWGCPRSHDVPIWIIQLLITKFMFDMFKMHLWDNQKIEKWYVM